MFLKDTKGTTISPWHDIPLYAGEPPLNAAASARRPTGAIGRSHREEPWAGVTGRNHAAIVLLLLLL